MADIILGAPIAQGNTAKIYLYEDKIIKIFEDRLPGTEAAYEAKKQKLAYLCGLPVPKIYDVATINGKQALVMEYVEGKTIGSIIHGGMTNAEHYMGMSVDIQLTVHAADANGLELMEERLSSRIRAAVGLSSKQRCCLLDRLALMNDQRKLCHGDFHVFNIILNDNRAFIIDWADASAGDVKADVCRSYLLYLQASEYLAELYLRMYCEKSGYSQDDILKWMPIIAGARLSEHITAEARTLLTGIVIPFLD